MNIVDKKQLIKDSAPEFNVARYWFVLSVFAIFMCLLIGRAVYLQLIHNDFFKEHGEARSVRLVKNTAYRGMITDRYQVPLAVSTPIQSIWTRPADLLKQPEKINLIAKILEIDPKHLTKKINQRRTREFMYLKRHADPEQSKLIKKEQIKGVNFDTEYRRYYPFSEVTAHIIGFNNIDDEGQEGLELAYNEWLTGSDGVKRVLKDRRGNIVKNIESISATRSGRDLLLSIDRRIQYHAYRALSEAVKRHRAKGANLIMLDIVTGEVIAMVGQPSYNPNNKQGLRSEYYRNRGVTDVFEPGSTIKPFTVVAALTSGQYQADTSIDTSPGTLKVGQHTIKDFRNYGVIDVSTVITKSSNVGVSKMALSLETEHLHKVFSQFGIGKSTNSTFPGEVTGLIKPYNDWTDLDVATMAYGYTLSVTTLQLAKAYATLAAGGVEKPISFTKVEHEVLGSRIISEDIANQINIMLRSVVSETGTGGLANIEGYHIAGKTGTVHKSIKNGYSEDRYWSLFAGFAPATNPRFAMVVVIDEPNAGKHFGGQVAAPVFSNVMAAALRISDIPPDDLSAYSHQVITGNQVFKSQEVSH